MNLYNEIKRELIKNNKTISEVKWAGTREIKIDLQKFLELAKQTEYDAGYGAPEIATDLLVVGDNWWLERHEYDGAEWFEFKEMPIEPSQVKKIKYLKTNDVGWETLLEINKEKKIEC